MSILSWKSKNKGELDGFWTLTVLLQHLLMIIKLLYIFTKEKSSYKKIK